MNVVERLPNEMAWCSMFSLRGDLMQKLHSESIVLTLAGLLKQMSQSTRIRDAAEPPAGLAVHKSHMLNFALKTLLICKMFDFCLF